MRRPYPCGIEIAGISPKNLLFITPHRRDALWALEQALKSGVLRAVIAEVATAPDFTESRRLQLAAVAGGALGVLLPPDSAHHSSAAETRWRAIRNSTQLVQAASPGIGLNYLRTKGFINVLGG